MAALKYIFAALLIAAVWATVLLLELPMWIAIVATVVIVLVLATYVIIKVVRAKKAAREIERALRAQADRHAQSARPDLRADIDAMQQEFLKAIAALKTSKLGGKKPAEALYALPWYMIIGPPGAGKSTALRNSGLRFPYLSKSGGGVQGVGGTRNCQWWMTNDAVILDTAGRYTTEDSDRDEWLSFLELLKKNRPKQPVNGVMVAIAVTDVSEAHPEDVHTRAREIRSRIDEVMAKLEMVVPVYVLFTKLDLLPGFVELFGDLGNTERRQIWGFTLPVTVKQDPAQSFVQNFDELGTIIERRAVRRMGEERRVEARDKIYEFPQYFEPMKEKLAMFVGELMADNVYAESPHLRGVYFTSGTQEGRTIDRIMNSMAAAFGIQPKLAYTTPQIEPKSYFLGELFEKVIFPDKLIAARSAAKIRKQALVGHGIGGGLLLLAFGLAVLPVMGFRNNRELLADTNQAIARIEEHHAAKSADPIRLEKLEPLRLVERELDSHEDDGTPLKLRFGMYQGERIYKHVRDLYLRTVRDELLRPILDIEVEQLQRLVQRYAPIQDEVKDSEHEEFEARLRFYLLLTCIPQVEGGCEYPPKGEPGLAHEKQRPWLVETIADKWAKPLELAGDVAATRSNMLAVAEAYIDIVAAEPGYLFERNTQLVDDVRKILNRTDQTEALLAELIRDVQARDVALSDIVNLDSLKNDDKVVPGAFTRQAWDNEIRHRVDTSIEGLLGDEWVLGLTAEQVTRNRDEQLEALRSRYFEEYIRHWRAFLGSLHTKAPDDQLEASAELRELTGGSSPPLVRLCEHLNYHTTLLEPPKPVEEDEDELLDKAGELGAKQLEKKGGKAGKALAGAGRDALEGRKERPRPRNPLHKTAEDVKKEFEGFVAFGYIDPGPVDPAAPPPPAGAVRADAYQEELKKVRDALQQKIDSESPEDTAKLVTTITAAIIAVDGLITETDTKGWNSTLSNVLKPPLQGLHNIADQSSSKATSSRYCAEVYDPITELLAMYPFTKEAKKSVTLKRFGEFFTPGTGKLWVYYQEALASRVPLKNNSFTLARAGAATSNKVNPQIAQFLNRAHDLSRSIYPVGSDKPSVPFQVQAKLATKQDSVTLTIDGTTHKFITGPEEWIDFLWPGDKGGAYLKVKYFGVQGDIDRENKEWGLFQLLEDGTITGGRDPFTIKFDLQDQEAGVVTLLVRPQDPDANPFFGTGEREVGFLEVFRHADLKPPKNVLIGGTTCGGGE